MALSVILSTVPQPLGSKRHTATFAPLAFLCPGSIALPTKSLHTSLPTVSHPPPSQTLEKPLLI